MYLKSFREVLHRKKGNFMTNFEGIIEEVIDKLPPLRAHDSLKKDLRAHIDKNVVKPIKDFLDNKETENEYSLFHAQATFKELMAYHRVHDENALQTGQVHDENALQTGQDSVNENGETKADLIRLEFKMVLINEFFWYFFIVWGRLQELWSITKDKMKNEEIRDLKRDWKTSQTKAIIHIREHTENQWTNLIKPFEMKQLKTTQTNLKKMYEDPIGLIDSSLEDPATSVLNTIQVNAKDDLNTLQRSKAKISDEEKDEALKLLKDMIEGSAVYMAFVDSFKRLRTQEALENEVCRLMEEYPGRTPFDTKSAQFRIYLDKGELLGPNQVY
eukprot:GHVL01003212.1.p1 GENE.GHVL01003212.1~~GHVL01003212.1.p1  ORF type:complete len:330 (-),score=51.82 GHVL01003212.1:81-1070(-)